MSEKLYNKLSEHTLLEPEMQNQLVKEVLSQSDGLFVVRGSLEDYRINEYGQVASVKQTGDKYELDINFSWPEEFESDASNQQERRVRDSLMRAGVVKPVNIDHVMSKLRQIDDIIIGVDTNIMLDCGFTAHLLQEIYKEKFPNWILIAVPKLVMAEIENKANSSFGGGNHTRVGWPDYQGRIGNRALEELLALDSKDEDRPGLSLLTVGNIDDKISSISQTDNWLLDSEIRSQFHDFLGQISFHKGTYFLSQDRVNVMMSGTEGSEGLYLQKPELEESNIGRVSLDQLSEIIYELCVQFGEVEIKNIGDEDTSVRMSVFWAGKQVSDWRRSRLRLETLNIPHW